MCAVEKRVQTAPAAEGNDADIPRKRADPSGLMQRALGGFPTGFAPAEQVILAWLMTLPANVDPPQAARSLLARRLPCCCLDPSPGAGAPGAEAVRGLLRFVASHGKPHVG